MIRKHNSAYYIGCLAEPQPKDCEKVKAVLFALADISKNVIISGGYIAQSDD